MTPKPEVAIPPMDGDVAYPRKNGEPVFDAPWQSRAFGMVVNLHTQGLYPWDDFKSRLIAQVADGDRAAVCAGAPEASGKGSTYYDQWVEAFSRLLVDKNMVTAEEMAQRIDDFKTGVRQQVY